MKKIIVILITIVIYVLPVLGSSGDGMTFLINNFKLQMNWTWQDKIPSLYGAEGVDIVLLIRCNYEILSKRNDLIWIDYFLDENANNVIMTFSREKNDEWDLFAEAEIPLDDSFYVNFENLIREKLKLKKRDIDECELYIAFIPISYIEPDSEYQKEVTWFLQQSELYWAHEMALQQNYQGYLYSIFFNKNVMYNSLKKLNVKKIIINKRTLNLDSVYSLDITLF
ncbi:hypothetical protein JW879_09840 [candidate division WOR-3 bacterium]|nr:hypothetical protein [candidate division WOR-3 bacterium]